MSELLIRSDKETIGLDPARDFLAGHRYFAGLSRDELDQIARLGGLRKLVRGETLALEGAPCDSVYLVVEGRMHAFKVSVEGREQIVTELPPGSVFYAVPALDGGPLPVTTQAGTRATLLSFSREDFIRIVTRHPSVALQVLGDLAGRLRRQTMLIEDLSLRSVPARLARLLLEGLHSPDGRRSTQREMAARLGTVREVVARTLARFDERGWIRLGRGVIEITDPKALEALVAGEETL